MAFDLVDVDGGGMRRDDPVRGTRRGLPGQGVQLRAMTGGKTGEGETPPPESERLEPLSGETRIDAGKSSPLSLTGPGGEGRAEEKPAPPPKNDFERFRRELIGMGWAPAEAAVRAERYRELLAMDPATEDGRVGRLLRTGIAEESAREMARTLPPEAVEQFVQDWETLEPDQRNAVARLLTRMGAAMGDGQRDAARINERIEQVGGLGGAR